MPRKPTEKIATAMQHLKEVPTATVSEAMRVAGYSETTIDKPGQNFTGLPTVQALAEEFKLALHTRIPNERIIAKLDALMDAQKATNAVVLLRKDGETVRAEEQGLIEVDDAPTQLKATQLVMQAKDLFGSTVNQQTNVQVNFGDLKSKYKKGGE